MLNIIIKEWAFFWKFPLEPHHMNYCLLVILPLNMTVLGQLWWKIFRNCGRDSCHILQSSGMSDCGFYFENFLWWFTQVWITDFIKQKRMPRTQTASSIWNTDFKLSDNIQNTEDNVYNISCWVLKSSRYYFDITVEIERVCRNN